MKIFVDSSVLIEFENMAVLASYDFDFERACQIENIKLISKVENLKTLH